MHKLEVHHIRFEISHGVRQLGECRLERIQRKRRIVIAGTSCGVAKRRS